MSYHSYLQGVAKRLLNFVSLSVTHFWLRKQPYKSKCPLVSQLVSALVSALDKCKIRLNKAN